MARGSKKKYTSKQKRKAHDIEKGYKKRGVSSKEAERRAWATVNKSDKGGTKEGRGRSREKAKQIKFPQRRKKRRPKVERPKASAIECGTMPSDRDYANWKQSGNFNRFGLKHTIGVTDGCLIRQIPIGHAIVLAGHPVVSFC